MGFWRGAPSAHTCAANLPAQLFWVPSMGVFALRDVKNCGFPGVALRARIPLHHVRPQKCFRMPSVRVFEMRNAQKCAVQCAVRSAMRSANTLILGILSKHTLCGRFGGELCALGAPRQNDTFFCIVQCKHPNPRYPKTPFLAYDVPRYGCLGRYP